MKLEVFMKILLALLLLVPAFAMAEDSVFVVLNFSGGSEKFNNFAKLKITQEIFKLHNEGISIVCRSKLDPIKHQYRILDGDISYIIRPSDGNESVHTYASKLLSIGNIQSSIYYREPFSPPYSIAFYGEQQYVTIVKNNPDMVPLEDLKEIIPSSPSKLKTYNSFFCLFGQNGEYIDVPLTVGSIILRQ